jgi:hypothetical protein
MGIFGASCRWSYINRRRANQARPGISCRSTRAGIGWRLRGATEGMPWSQAGLLLSPGLTARTDSEELSYQCSAIARHLSPKFGRRQLLPGADDYYDHGGEQGFQRRSHKRSDHHKSPHSPLECNFASASARLLARSLACSLACLPSAPSPYRAGRAWPYCDAARPYQRSTCGRARATVRGPSHEHEWRWISMSWMTGFECMAWFLPLGVLSVRFGRRSDDMHRRMRRSVRTQLLHGGTGAGRDGTSPLG